MLIYLWPCSFFSDICASHTVGTVTSTVPTVTPIGTPELSGVRSGGRAT